MSNDTAPKERFLAGQSAIVTGASSGLGAAIAEALAERGANVAVNYRGDREGGEKTLNRCLAHNVSAELVQADVSDEDDIARLFETTANTLGGVDILIANAGLQQDNPFTEITKAQWDKVIAVNLTGAFLCMQHAVRRFRTQGRRNSRALGKIIAVSSVHDVIPWAGHANYAASKAGLTMLVKTGAQELAPEGIRINAISPGAIKTPINASVTADPEKAEALMPLIPYGRIGDPPDIGNAAAWLASDYADYMNGTTMVVDGGMELYPEFSDNG